MFQLEVWELSRVRLLALHAKQVRLSSLKLKLPLLLLQKRQAKQLLFSIAKMALLLK
jgi:hypothetical protein